MRAPASTRRFHHGNTLASRCPSTSIGDLAADLAHVLDALDRSGCGGGLLLGDTADRHHTAAVNLAGDGSVVCSVGPRGLADRREGGWAATPLLALGFDPPEALCGPCARTLLDPRPLDGHIGRYEAGGRCRLSFRLPAPAERRPAAGALAEAVGVAWGLGAGRLWWAAALWQPDPDGGPATWVDLRRLVRAESAAAGAEGVDVTGDPPASTWPRARYTSRYTTKADSAGA